MSSSSERTPNVFVDQPLPSAILRGWRDRSADEGLTLTDIEEELLRMKQAPLPDLELALMQLEVDGWIVCDPGTSQRVYRLRGFPQPLLDELDRLRLNHERVLERFEEVLHSGGLDEELRLQVEAAMLAVEELQACLVGGAEGRRRFLEKRARVTPDSRGVEQMDEALSRADAMGQELRVETDRRLEQLTPVEQHALAAYVDAMLDEARLRIAWGRPESALRQLERTKALVIESTG